MITIGLLIIGATVVCALGSYHGRSAMLKDFGMTWADYNAKLNGKRPT